MKFIWQQVRSETVFDTHVLSQILALQFKTFIELKYISIWLLVKKITNKSIIIYEGQIN